MLINTCFPVISYHYFALKNSFDPNINKRVLLPKPKTLLNPDTNSKLIGRYLNARLKTEKEQAFFTDKHIELIYRYIFYNVKFPPFIYCITKCLEYILTTFSILCL